MRKLWGTAVVFIWLDLLVCHGFAMAESGMILGTLGLNTVPSARMDAAGSARFSISHLKPYTHKAIGFQFTEAFYVSLRQSHSSLGNDAHFPGVDAKLRLIKENKYRPAIAIGVQSMIGRERFAGEYITFSKRYNKFDFTGGIGWGRYGQAENFKNPLRLFGQHFQKERVENSISYNSPDNWFSGGSAALFGGVEYGLPIEGLSMKLDYTSDRYLKEELYDDFKKSDPWGISISYSPKPWVNAQLGAQGLDKIMASLTLSSPVDKWPIRSHKLQNRGDIGQKLSNIRQNGTIIFSDFNLSSDETSSSPAQLGMAIKNLDAYVEPKAKISGMKISPLINGFRGPTISISRQPVDKSVYNQVISPEEIWANTDFSTEKDENFARKNESNYRKIPNLESFNLVFENLIDISEPEADILYRTSIIAEAKSSVFLGFLSAGGAFRLGLYDNFEKLNGRRANLSNDSIRSDLNLYTEHPIGVDNLYLTAAKSFSPSIHSLITSGYVEEQFAGTGGEILYRPPSSRFAIGAEAWSVTKRDPNTFSNMGFLPQNEASALLNAWYDLTEADVTISASAGQFLGGDIGGYLGIDKTFRNGARLSGNVTITNNSDIDTSGRIMHAYHNIRLILPLGELNIVPDGSFANTEIGSLMRNHGQRVHSPSKLYNITEKFSLKHMSNNWGSVIP